MEEQTILKAYRDRDDGVIVHERPQPDKNPKKTKYVKVIGGISWPTDISPAYFCILGKLWDGQYRRVNQRREGGNLEFLDEHESDSLSLDEFIERLTDSAKMFYCEQFYADLNEEFGGYVKSYNDYLNFIKMKDPRPVLYEAPYNDNFLYGIHLIKDCERKKEVKIPESSIVYKQLKTIGREHLQDRPEVHFYAVNALRFVVGAFFKNNYGPENSSRYWEWKERRVRIARGGR